MWFREHLFNILHILPFPPPPEIGVTFSSPNHELVEWITHSASAGKSCFLKATTELWAPRLSYDMQAGIKSTIKFSSCSVHYIRLYWWLLKLSNTTTCLTNPLLQHIALPKGGLHGQQTCILRLFKPKRQGWRISISSGQISFVPAKELQVSAAARPKQLDRSTQFGSAWNDGMFLNSSFQWIYVSPMCHKQDSNSSLLDRAWRWLHGFCQGGLPLWDVIAQRATQCLYSNSHKKTGLNPWKWTFSSGRWLHNKGTLADIIRRV